MLINATGYATANKFALQEAQLRSKLKDFGILDKFDIIDFQWIGRPQADPSSQLASTSYLRIFAQARDRDVIARFMPAWGWNAMQHFSGMHLSGDHRNALPKPFLGFYPAVIPQSDLEESINIIDRKDGTSVQRSVVGPPKKTEAIGKRESYETENAVDLSSFGETVMAPLGDVALARSGDKGANVNFGVYVHTAEEWDWLRSLMTKAKLQELMGATWENWFFIERSELPDMKAVHFVVYGPLGRVLARRRYLIRSGRGLPTSFATSMYRCRRSFWVSGRAVGVSEPIYRYCSHSKTIERAN